MKKIPLICLVLVCSLLFSSVFALAAEQEPAAVTDGCSSVRGKVPLGTTDRLAETAEAVMLYELNTDTLVYGWNLDGRIDPTGMVKLLTVLVALDAGNLSDEVTVKRSTLNTVAIGSVSANLQAGEVISLGDLLYCIMVASANDAAAVAAEHIAGSQTAFVEMMNQKAQELGCTDSHFENVHGLSGTNQYTTARDLAIIVEAALENALFTQMFCAEEYTVPATNKSEPRRIITTNYMMSTTYTEKYLDSRLTGGKTAAATLTNRSLICTAEVGTSRYLCIVMGALAQVSTDGFVVERYGSFEETKIILDYGFNHFAVRQIADKSQTFAQYSVTDGENDVTVQTSRDLFTVLPVDFVSDDLEFDAVVNAAQLQAPVTKGDVVGQLRVSYHGVILAECDLLAMYDVTQDGQTIQNAVRLEEPEQEKVNYKRILVIVAIVVASILLLFALILVIIRLVNNARIRQMHRRRKRNRRRSK